MRPAVERLREQFETIYPLAMALPWLDHAGRDLVLRIQDDVALEGALRLVIVRNGQLVLTAPADQFYRSATFEGGIIRALHPSPELAAITIDPLRQFGEPSVRNVPTSVLAEQFRAGDGIAAIAETYELTGEQVEQALRFELLRGGEQPAA